MKPPFAGGAKPPLGHAFEGHFDDLTGFESWIGHAGGSNEDGVGESDADIPGGALVESPLVEILSNRDQASPQIISGNSDASPSSLAGHTPRSVINPVTRREGVTSKP